jgi:hypothetical protein
VGVLKLVGQEHQHSGLFDSHEKQPLTEVAQGVVVTTTVVRE